jgi:hypothetical protein
MEILSAFQSLGALDHSIRFVFLCEQTPLVKDGRDARMVVEPISAFSLLSERPGIAMMADHTSICKYEGEDDLGYRKVSGELMELYKELLTRHLLETIGNLSQWPRLTREPPGWSICHSTSGMSPGVELD